VYDLAHVLHEAIPAFPGRTFRQYLTTNYHQINRRRPDAGPSGLGRNNVNWIVEQVTATQQMGTHMDGLNHLQVGENLRLTDIAREGVPEFLLVISHAKLRGATGAWVAPLAIV
jgi:kynurenine formamidase